ncbi:MAG TPA: tRNA (adenosine(37)-N6)-threonylcarbamoyltransferase complex ATPase subunit type 1 TsaE, partial [Clostridiales bacterium]|nr:tRNA (adenosine(37)-N6)-threonylcarbamoyltransferase complex ATPase subunit type 1 TsaE [Clostridiales bacterium]
MIQTISANSPEMTEKVGEVLATSLLRAGVRRTMIALDGEMGVGKTAFA